MKVCSKKDCEFAGKTQELNAFYEDERRCKSCEKKRRRIYNKTYSTKLVISRKKYYNTVEGRFIHYGSNAKRKHTIFEIDFEFAKNLFLSECFYCGIKSINELNGIDRKNNLIGYTKDNCVSCCAVCNFLKNNHDYIFFIQHIKKIYENLKQGASI